jgi:hypothetical protein
MNMHDSTPNKSTKFKQPEKGISQDQEEMSHSGRPDLHYSSALTSLVPLAKLFSLYFFICSVAGTIIPITKGFCEDFKR